MNYEYKQYTDIIDNVIRHLNENQVPKDNIIYFCRKNDLYFTVVYTQATVDAEYNEWIESKRFKKGLVKGE